MVHGYYPPAYLRLCRETLCSMLNVTLDHCAFSILRRRPQFVHGYSLDKEDVGGIEVAKGHGIPIIQEIVNRQLPVEERRREQELRIIKQLEQYEIQLIVLSGYMRLLSSEFVEQFAPNIINIHPSLLPAFPGADAHIDVLASGVKVSGCTIHVVDA